MSSGERENESNSGCKRSMRKIIPPSSVEEHSRKGFVRQSVRVSLDKIRESDEEIVESLLEILEKFGKIEVVVKSYGDNKENRVAMLFFDQDDEYEKFRDVILVQKEKIYIFNRLLFFEFSRRDQTSSEVRHRSPIVSRTYSERRRTSLERKREQPRRRSMDSRNNNNSNRMYQKYDDNWPTRTLYVGNLSRTVSYSEIKRIFQKYGEIIDIVLKRQDRFPTYGFVKFLSLDGALAAKERLAGTMVGRHKMAVGFGSICTTELLWMKLPGQDINVNDVCLIVKRYAEYLDFEFDRHRKYIYFVFKNTKDSRMVISNVRRCLYPGSSRRIQVDYADPMFEASAMYDRYHTSKRNESKRSLVTKETSDESSGGDEKSVVSGENRSDSEKRDERSGHPTKRKLPLSDSEDDLTNVSKKIIKTQEIQIKNLSDKNLSEHYGYESVEVERANMESRNTTYEVNDKKETDNNYQNDYRASEHLGHRSLKRSGISSNSSLEEAVNYSRSEGAEQSSLSVWRYRFGMKGLYYPVKTHYISGNKSLINSLKDEKTGKPLEILQFTKRYSLDHAMLEDFKTVLASSMLTNDYCVLLGFPVPVDSYDARLTRHLREFIAYLTDKTAAAHISSINPGSHTSLFALPPCEFSKEFLRSVLTADNRMVLNLASDSHLLIFLVSQ